MEQRPQRSLVLILAREFASQLATPTFIADADGELVFYNEPAEEVLGRTYAEAGPMPAARWSSLFRLEDVEGEPVGLERTPGGIVLSERRPDHGKLRLTGLDGARRLVSVFAIPLFSPTEFAGAFIVFWQDGDPPAA